MEFTAARPIEDEDDISSFASGNETVDSWVHRHAKRAPSNSTAVVYVSFPEGTDDALVAGVYTLSTRSVRRDEITSRRLTRNTPDQIPCILLGILGVDRNYQGLGLGSRMLADAIVRCVDASLIIGTKALVVEPADEKARDFYRHYDFADAGNGMMYILLR